MNSPSNGFKNEADELVNSSASTIEAAISETKLKGPFFGSELGVSKGLDEVTNSSDFFLKPLLGEFIS